MAIRGKPSGFHIYSMGVVAENKPANTDYLKVFPTEKMSQFKGELKKTQTMTGSHSKELELGGKSKLTKTAWVQCQWLPSEASRGSSPDMKVGETVYIYKYGSSETLYWQATSKEKDLRGKEAILNVISNSDDPTVMATPDNSWYWLMDNKHEKRFKLKTNMNDGEVCFFEIEGDMKNGWFRLIDNNGNIIKLDSVKQNIEVHTKHKLILECEDLEINTRRDATINITRDLTMNVGRDYFTRGERHGLQHYKGNYTFGVEKDSNSIVDGTSKYLAGSELILTGHNNVSLTGKNAFVKAHKNVKIHGAKTEMFSELIVKGRASFLLDAGVAGNLVAKAYNILPTNG